MQGVHTGAGGVGYKKNLPAVTPHPLPHRETGGSRVAEKQNDWLK